MEKITEKQYKYALGRVEEPLPLVTDDLPPTDPKALELSTLSDLIIEYEKLHYSIEKN